MAVLSHKFHRVLKKALGFTKVGRRHIEALGSYEKLKIEEKKQSGCGGARKGYVPVYVGENDEPKILYEVPTAAMNSPAFVSMLDQYRDDIPAGQGPLLLPCSAVAFEHVLSRAIACV